VKTEFVRGYISPLATRVCARLGWVDRRQVDLGVRKLNDILPPEARAHLWFALAAVAPTITPRSVLMKIVKAPTVLKNAPQELSQTRPCDYALRITAKGLADAANKFKEDSGLDYLSDLIKPMVAGEVAEFDFTKFDTPNNVIMLKEALRGQRKKRILKGLFAEEPVGREWKSKVVDQALRFAAVQSGLTPEQIDYRMRKSAAIHGDVKTIVASFFMDIDALALRQLFDATIKDDAGYKELYLYSDAVCSIVARAQFLENNFSFDFAQLGEDPKLIYRKMCELIRGAETLQVLLLFFLNKLISLKSSDPLKDEVFDAVRFVIAPLAERIGLIFLADDFRDQYLKHSNPVKYREVVEKIESRLGMTYEEAKEFMEIYVDKLIDYLDSKGVNIDNLTVYARLKSPFSAYEKVEDREEGHTYENLMDLMGIKIVYVSSLAREKEVSDAEFLGYLLTKGDIFVPTPGGIKKALAGTKGKWLGIKITGHNKIGKPVVPIEIQIMTEEMNAANNHGKAAHWLYKLQEILKMLGVAQIFPKQEIADEMGADPYRNFEQLRHFWTEDVKGFGRGALTG
jgi:hypothetical protein